MEKQIAQCQQCCTKVIQACARIFRAGSCDHALYIGSYISQRHLRSMLSIQRLYIYSRVNSAYDTHLNPQLAAKLQLQVLHTGRNLILHFFLLPLLCRDSKHQRCMPHSA